MYDKLVKNARLELGVCTKQLFSVRKLLSSIWFYCSVMWTKRKSWKSQRTLELACAACWARAHFITIALLSRVRTYRRVVSAVKSSQRAEPASKHRLWPATCHLLSQPEPFVCLPVILFRTRRSLLFPSSMSLAYLRFLAWCPYYTLL